MHHLRQFRSLAVFLSATFLALFMAGCSAEARKGRILARADGFFAAGQYDKAEIEYKNVLQGHGLDPQAMARLGTIYYEQGRIGPAFQVLTKASELQPANQEVRLKLGLCMLNVGRTDDARAAAAQVLEANQANDEAFMLLAEASTKPRDIAAARVQLKALPKQTAAVLSALALLELRENRVKEAEALLLRAHETDAKFAPASSLLGAVYASQKDNARAATAYASAAAAAPARSPFRVQYAQFQLQTGNTPGGKKTLEEIIKTAPDYIPARVLMAKVAAGENNYDEGIANLDKVLALDGTHPEALLLLAQLRLAKGDKEKAIITLETATRLYPRAPEAHYRLGSAYFVNGELGKAAASFAQAIAVAPDFAVAIVALAELNVRQSNFGPAIDSLKELLKKNPGIVEAQLLLASAYRLQGNLPDALAAYRQLARIDPKNSQAHLLAGLILMQQGQNAGARAELTAAAELAPDDFAVVEQLVALDLAEKKSPAALERVRELIGRHPQNGRLQVLLARVLSARSEFPAAEAALRKAIELEPDSLEPYFALVQLLTDTNQQQKAIAELGEAASKNPKDIRPLMLLATLHEQQKDFAAAGKAYERVLAIDPKVAVALNNLAYIFSEHVNDQDKALEYAQRARDLLPDRWEAADTLGWIFYKKGQPARAVPLLEEAITKNPDGAELRYHLGMAYYLTGDEAKSRTALARALQLNPNFPGAAEASASLSLLNLDPLKADALAKSRLEAMAGKRKDDAVVFSRLGRIYEQEGDRDKALSAYETALKASPAHIAAALGAIRVLRAKGDTAKATDLAKTARKLAPGDPYLAQALARLSFDAGDFAAAALLSRDAARQLPADPTVLLDLAEATYSVGRVAEAQNALRDLLEKSPGFAQAAKAREFSEMIALSADPAKALAAVVKIAAALSANPQDVPALMAKGLVAEENKDADAARKIYLRAVERFPDFAPAKKRLAILYAAKADDDKKGLEFATKAREAFPSDADVARALGVLTYRTGNFARAASLLAESARTRSTDAELIYYLGMAQQKAKDPAAPRSLQKALALGLPDNLAKEAKQALATAK